MRVLAAIGLAILFVIGAVLGLAIGLVVFAVSLLRGARAVHPDGVVYRSELIAHDRSAAPDLAGPGLVRLSGAFSRQASAESDVLGVAIRLQRAASDDAGLGDQDLLLGTFESFRTAGRDRARTNVGDYLANRYSSVTPWWLPGHGPVTLRLAPLDPTLADRDADRRSRSAEGGASDGAAGLPRATDRLARLEADVAAGHARLALVATTGTTELPIGELRPTGRIDTDGDRLRASMFRHGRGVWPLGLRNGIRATVYPFSQAARGLRGH